MDRIEQSNRVILQHQAANGAFVASPSFPHYRYSWLRDGTFTAHGLDCIGKEQEAAAFFRWAALTIERYRQKAVAATELSRQGKVVPKELLLHTRYTIDGSEVEGDWGTFQLDGYGTFLWGVSKHIELSRNQSLFLELLPTIRLVTDYLLSLWQLPNFDCWEEFGDFVHPATIAAIYGGISAVLPMLEENIAREAEEELRSMKEYLVSTATLHGRFTKSIGIPDVDASLIWLNIPYQMFDATDALLEQTIKEIEEQLVFAGGVHRYPQDTYYGGGQWILLSAFLGWYYVEKGELDKAKEMLCWVEQQFDEQGDLAEQVQHHLLSPDHYQHWVQKWGPPANPLLWSHGMYLILKSKIVHTENTRK